MSVKLIALEKYLSELCYDRRKAGYPYVRLMDSNAFLELANTEQASVGESKFTLATAALEVLNKRSSSHWN